MAKAASTNPLSQLSTLWISSWSFLRIHALTAFVHPCTAQLGDKLTHPQELTIVSDWGG